jgi:uncharacterized membrane protein ArfC
MNNVNWWLMALAAVLGLLLTFAFMIQRVKRQIPVYAALGASAGVKAASVKAPHVSPPDAPTTKLPHVSAPDVHVKAPRQSGPDAPTMEMPLVSAPDVKAPHVSGGELAAGAATFADVPPGPYGVGSAKPGVGGSGPESWTIKGNEDSMLYHTLDSPSYKQTIAEVWFNDEDVATKAGFTRWDKRRHPRN